MGAPTHAHTHTHSQHTRKHGHRLTRTHASTRTRTNTHTHTHTHNHTRVRSPRARACACCAYAHARVYTPAGTRTHICVYTRRVSRCMGACRRHEAKHGSRAWRSHPIGLQQAVVPRCARAGARVIPSATSAYCPPAIVQTILESLPSTGLYWRHGTAATLHERCG